MAWFVTVREESHPEFTFEDGLRAEYLGVLIGGHAIVEPSKLPTSAKAGDPRKLSTDIVGVNASFSGGGGGAVVSRNLKEAIETVEPGVHQFFPMVLKQRDGTPFPGEFHLLRVRRLFPCVLFRESDHQPLGSVKVEPDVGKPIYRCHDTGLVISRPAMSGHHLFSNSIVSGGYTIMSDTMMTECNRRKIKGIRAHPAKELDKRWDPEVEVPELMQWLQEHPERAAYMQQFFDGIRS